MFETMRTYSEVIAETVKQMASNGLSWDSVPRIAGGVAIGAVVIILYGIVAA